MQKYDEFQKLILEHSNEVFIYDYGNYGRKTHTRIKNPELRKRIKIYKEDKYPGKVKAYIRPMHIIDVIRKEINISYSINEVIKATEYDIFTAEGFLFNLRFGNKMNTKLACEFTQFPMYIRYNNGGSTSTSLAPVGKYRGQLVIRRVYRYHLNGDPLMISRGNPEEMMVKLDKLKDYLKDRRRLCYEIQNRIEMD